ncbi:MAG: 1-acyl-sn-glycerol-3-phosphate acyltransferase [Acidobacteria bacterium]|nr:1-acyl-sn-glycerol-3-phosphate acyltransferase [Acidobacteriota bacterium]
MSFAFLRTILWTDPLILLCTSVMGLINLFVVPFDKDGEKQIVMAKIWGRMLTWVMGMDVEITGKEKLVPGQHYIFAGNHRSYSDTPALLATLPRSFRFMAKESLFKIPLMGHHLKLAGHVPVSLDNPRAALKSLFRAGDIVRDKKLSVLIFPEGGRTEGALEPFKDGAAIIGIRSGVPIVPFGLIGTRDVMPMHHATVRGGPVKVLLGDPIITTEYTIKEKSELTTRLRNEVAALLGVEP